jgi:glucokinase
VNSYLSQTPLPLLAIEIGGTKLQLCVGTSHGTILDRRRCTVNPERGGEGIRSEIQRILPELIALHRPAAIGVGYGGPVNWRTGQVVKSYHVPGWTGFSLGPWLKEISGLPVFVENDANAAALGEAIHGAGRGFDPVFYVTIGSGMGGGLIHEARIYHGASPTEAEIGHLALDRSRLRPEDVCSGWSIDRGIREGLAKNPDSVLTRLCLGSPGGEARHLGLAITRKDSFALRILETASGHIAHALSHVVHLFNPEILILGGGVSLLGEPLRTTVDSQLRPLLMDALLPGPEIRLSELREDAVPVGALALAAQRLQTSAI